MALLPGITTWGDTIWGFIVLMWSPVYKTKIVFLYLIEGLEQCPFCPFATIMDTLPEQNKLFACQNPDCGKESCRLCKEISHIPLRCEEVEKDAEVRKRTFIENKMTEAMVRRCWKCSKPFIKLGKSILCLKLHQ